MTTEDLVDWATGRGLEIVLVALGSVLLARVARSLSFRVTLRIGRDDRHARPLAQALAWLATASIYLVATLVILQKCNLPLASLVPPATVAGVAVGFGAQKIVSDLLSGFFLFAERQLGYGDVVRIGPPGSTEGVTGTVEELTLRTTRLRTLSGDVVFIPNGEIRQVANLSLDWARCILDIPLPSGTDLTTATTVLEGVCATLRDDPLWSPLFLDDPIVSGVEAIDLGVFRVRIVARTAAGKQHEVARELRRRIGDALNAANIVIVAPRS